MDCLRGIWNGTTYSRGARGSASDSPGKGAFLFFVECFGGWAEPTKLGPKDVITFNSCISVFFFFDVFGGGTRQEFLHRHVQLCHYSNTTSLIRAVVTQKLQHPALEKNQGSKTLNIETLPLLFFASVLTLLFIYFSFGHSAAGCFTTPHPSPSWTKPRPQSTPTRSTCCTSTSSRRAPRWCPSPTGWS